MLTTCIGNRNSSSWPLPGWLAARLSDTPSSDVAGADGPSLVYRDTPNAAGCP
ncbi:MAG: hypothetical protein IT521_11090 [Burkholderiales bacterium]|nr:hypothetical protein [Burkholderiales bacterium]